MSTNAKKYDTGKPQLSLIPLASQEAMLNRLARPEYMDDEQFKNYKTLYKLMSEFAQGNTLYPSKRLHGILYACENALGGPWKFACACAKSMEFGKDKYCRNNWQGGFDDSRLLDASMRHCLQYLTGQEFDEDSGNLHCEHIPFGLSVIANQYQERFYGKTVGKDDINA